MGFARQGWAVGVAVGMGLWCGAAVAAEPVRIGAVLSVTGPASFLGDPEKKVLELYVARANKAGGVAGRPLELVTYDDGGDASKAASFTKRLIDSDKVDVLLGGSTTATTMAAVPLAEKAEIPFVSFAGGLAIVDPVKKWVFKTPHTDRMAAEKIFADMKKHGIAKIALISEDAGFGKSGHEQCLAVAANFGIDILADETYSPKDPDTTAQLTKIKATPGVQAVLDFGFGQGPAIVTRNYKQLGMTQPLYQSHGVASKEFIKLAGDAAEGVRLPAAGLVVADQLPAADPQKPVVTAFRKDYAEAFGAEPSTFAGHAYDGLALFLGALQRAGSADKARVRDELEKSTGYVGTGGIVTMTPADHMGLQPAAFHMVEIRKGDWALAD